MGFWVMPTDTMTHYDIIIHIKCVIFCSHFAVIGYKFTNLLTDFVGRDVFLCIIHGAADFMHMGKIRALLTSQRMSEDLVHP